MSAPVELHSTASQGFDGKPQPLSTHTHCTPIQKVFISTDCLNQACRQKEFIWTKLENEFEYVAEKKKPPEMLTKGSTGGGGPQRKTAQAE